MINPNRLSVLIIVLRPLFDMGVSMSLTRFNWKTLLAYLLAVFFLIGAVGNTFVSDEIAADYARWGYPSWFHYLTAVLELIAAILLAVASTRFWGAALGAAVMGAAIATVLLNGEFAHAIAPVVVLAVALVVGWQNRARK